jgi:hypothetical protein
MDALRDVLLTRHRNAMKDSASSAAIRSIQLNEKIGGQAVHYREVQGHESEKFQQLFNYKIKYLRGGTESALNHVTEEAYETRLLHLLGKKGVVRQARCTLAATIVECQLSERERERART